MKEFTVRITLTEEMLGMSPSDPNVYDTYVAGNAPSQEMMEEEMENFTPADEKGMTVFPKLEDGTPFIWDYQIKGLMKDACGMLRAVPGTKSAAMKAYKKTIDGRIFVSPRKIPIHVVGEMGTCQRPLRASTPQGERVALAKSETIPAGSWFECQIQCLVDSDVYSVNEWLEYGKLRGLGQWRNSGAGRFLFDVLDG